MIFRKYVSIEEAKKLFPDHDERRNKEYMTFEEFHEALEAGKIKDLVISEGEEMAYIFINVSREDYDKIKNIEEVKEIEVPLCNDIKGILLQTSSAEYILFTCHDEGRNEKSFDDQKRDIKESK